MENDSQEEPVDLSIQSNHRARDNQVLPYPCGKGRCEKTFPTNTELQEHWSQNHAKCDRCNGVYANSTGLKIHQNTCVLSDAVNPLSFHSIDSGVASIRSTYSRTSEIPSTSSSIGSNESRHAEDNVIKVTASCKHPITPDMRHVIFGLPTALVALVVAAEKNIDIVNEETLDKILKEGQAWFKQYAINSNGGGLHGCVSPSQMRGRIPIDLRDASLILTFSPVEILNPVPEFSGPLERKKLFSDLSRLSKEHQLGVLKVGDFYMALVIKNDFLYVFNPGIGTSNGFQDSSDHPAVMASLRKCHRRGSHLLVDELIDLFTTENNLSDQLEYVIMPAFISKA